MTAFIWFLIGVNVGMAIELRWDVALRIIRDEARAERERRRMEYDARFPKRRK